MNATEDGAEPVGEGPVDTLDAIERGAVIGVLSAADKVLATKQLAERQAQALNAVRELHRSVNLVSCEECGLSEEVCGCATGFLISRPVCEECGQDEDEEWTDYPCATIRALDEAGA